MDPQGRIPLGGKLAVFFLEPGPSRLTTGGTKKGWKGVQKGLSDSGGK